MSQAAEHHADTRSATETTVMTILWSLSLSHLLNDTIQSLLPAIYPVLKDKYLLSFAQIGTITFVFQCTASLLQPIVGFYTDRRPQPFSLALGMGATLAGLVLLSQAPSFHLILVSAALVGIGSSVFHPEASRVARLASGGQHGLAQSLFQVGGNLGSSFGPLLAALVVVPHGQHSIVWFSGIAVVGIYVLARVGAWYRSHLQEQKRSPAKRVAPHSPLSRGRVALAMGVLVVLVFSKYIYLVSLSNYYTFYLIDRFHLTVQGAQYGLFVFLFAVAAGTFIGGPVGDRIGRKRVIWVSILGVAPFSLLLPHVGLAGTIVLTVFIGTILASAFSAIIVYAQELVPGNVGLIAGLFFGLAFGTAGIASALLGHLADHTSIRFVFELCAFFPLLGLLTAFLPDLEPRRP
ncbi:MAG TPA: MFS transporter [Lacunisphaera sp.]|jgi:FSR family fosmidomycin resistance protein-like MFS transporter|nr:MFS transporter [Lacunisphaera sp.]